MGSFAHTALAIKSNLMNMIESSAKSVPVFWILPRVMVFSSPDNPRPRPVVSHGLDQFDTARAGHGRCDWSVAGKLRRRRRQNGARTTADV
jgi:hypothetical protein